MTLNFYQEETNTQSSSMNAICDQVIQSMQETMTSIHSFHFAVNLQGQAYSSAKGYMSDVYLPLAKGIMSLCEELKTQNTKYPSDFRAQVSSSDVIELEIMDQIDQINRLIEHTESLSLTGILANPMIVIYTKMKGLLKKKLADLHTFETSSTGNYALAIQLAEQVSNGLSQVQNGGGFNSIAGIFTTNGMDLDWVSELDTLHYTRYSRMANEKYHEYLGTEDADIEKAIAVIKHEEEHPDDAERTSNFLSPLEQKDTVEIKYLIYTADEPYRTLAIQYLHRIEIIDVNASGGKFYSDSNEMQFNVAKDRESDKGVFMTFFHELGHAIDYNVGLDHGEESFLSETHVWNGNTLSDHMFMDVETKIQTELAKELEISRYKDFSATDKSLMTKNITDEFIYTGPSDDDLTSKEEEIFDVIKPKISAELDTNEDDTASDVFGSVTANEIKGKWAHHNVGYWVEDNGERKRGPNKEGFANYFGSMMLEDNNFKEMKFDSLDEHLSLSREHMDEIINDMAGDEE